MSALLEDVLYRRRAFILPIRTCLAHLITNAGTSDYNALQLQFQRRLSRGLQALASYSWSHSLDTASAGSMGSGSNALSALNSNVNRGPSDFDIRNAFSIGLTYDVPAPKGNAFANSDPSRLVH